MTDLSPSQHPAVVAYFAARERYEALLDVCIRLGLRLPSDADDD